MMIFLGVITQDYFFGITLLSLITIARTILHLPNLVSLHLILVRVEGKNICVRDLWDMYHWWLWLTIEIGFHIIEDNNNWDNYKIDYIRYFDGDQEIYKLKTAYRDSKDKHVHWKVMLKLSSARHLSFSLYPLF